MARHRILYERLQQNLTLGTPPTLVIRKVTFYRASLAAPLVIPALALALAYLMPVPFVLPGVLIGGSLMFTWWSYPLFAAAVLLWSRDRSAEDFERAGKWLPLLYAPFCALQLATFYGRPFAQAPVTWWSDFFSTIPIAAAYGYVYLGATHFVRRLLSDPRGSAEGGRRPFIAPGT